MPILCPTRLDDFASEQNAKDAAIEAKKAALRAKQAEVEAKAQEAFEKQQALDAEREAKKAAAKQALAEQKAAVAKAAAEKKATTGASKTSSTPSAKASKYGTVEKINKQADRIAEREENGGDKPSFCAFDTDSNAPSRDAPLDPTSRIPSSWHLLSLRKLLGANQAATPHFLRASARKSMHEGACIQHARDGDEDKSERRDAPKERGKAAGLEEGA